MTEQLQDPALVQRAAEALARMEKYNAPPTREVYLEWFFDRAKEFRVTTVIDRVTEAAFPSQFRLASA